MYNLRVPFGYDVLIYEPATSLENKPPLTSRLRYNLSTQGKITASAFQKEVPYWKYSTRGTKVSSNTSKRSILLVLLARKIFLAPFINQFQNMVKINLVIESLRVSFTNMSNEHPNQHSSCLPHPFHLNLQKWMNRGLWLGTEKGGRVVDEN